MASKAPALQRDCLMFRLNRYEVDLEKITHYNQDLTFKTLSELMRHSIEHYADRPSWGEKKDGVYVWMTYGEFGVRMLKMRAFLKKNGLTKGDRLAIIAGNCIPFAEAAYGAYGLGAIVVPMYEVQSLEDWKFIFHDAAPRIAIVKNDKIREKIESLAVEGLEKILVIAPDEGPTLDAQIDAETPMAIDDDVAEADDLCDIIYTSGTTGCPRGVELTHHNVVHDVIISASMFDYGCHDRVLSFLPWAHAFGKTVDFTLFPALGAAVGLAESTKTIAKNLTEVNPTVLCAVPKIFNSIYEQVHLKLERSKVQRFLITRAQTLMHHARTRALNPLEKIEYRLMDRLVASKVRHVFGDSLKFCVSGGASLSREVATFFEDFGVRVFEGYGMTEHAPVISINYNPDKIGSVGKPLPTVQIEIEPLDLDDTDTPNVGEIVITSECIMRGYHHNPEATQAVIDERGRLHTGDTGFIDDEGFVHIIGRVKDQYKLANGKYVVPAALEEKFNLAPEIDFSIMFGAGKKYNVLLVHPSAQWMDKFYATHADLRDAAPEIVEEHPDLRNDIAQAIHRIASDFRGYEKPQRFAITLEEFSIHNGLLTPALKIKRRSVEKHFGDRIEKLYQDN